MSRCKLLLALMFAALGVNAGDYLPSAGGEAVRAQPVKKSLLQPSSNLARMTQLNFWTGLTLFQDPWIQAPASTTDRDGLGPLFNARSCTGCHVQGGRGKPVAEGQLPVSLLLKFAAKNGAAPGHSAYGGQLQTRGVGARLGAGSQSSLNLEALPKVRYDYFKVKYADGAAVELRRPSYRLEQLNYGELSNKEYLSLRNTPSLMGVGLLDAIPEASIMANADPDDADADGVRGIVSQVASLRDKAQRVGRFGWKAQHPNLIEQVAEALNQDMGITSVLMPADMCTPEQKDCLAAPNGRDPVHGVEITPQLFDVLMFTSSHIAPPPPKRRDQQINQGEVLFAQVGCASCHRPSYVTDKRYHDPALAGQKIWPYTDLLLHDMGPELADVPHDQQVITAPMARLWKTPALWGIGLTEKIRGSGGFLHDGRARTVEEAILWHGGEAQRSQTAYRKLEAAQRIALLKFINAI